jgi:hypothetical protein
MNQLAFHLRRALPLVLCGALSVIAAAAAQHSPATGAADALARFEREHREGRPGSRSGIRMVFRILSRESGATASAADSVADGLERMALGSGLPIVRHAAATWLSLVGEASVRTPAPGTVQRMEAVYRRTGDPVVRSILVGRMDRMAERQSALKFLRGVAVQPTENADFEGAPWHAVSALARMGSPGLDAIRDLSSRGLLRDETARAYARRHGG